MALENEDLSLETLEGILGVMNFPASPRRKNVIRRGETKVHGMLLGIYCHNNSVGITKATEECPFLTRLITKILRSVDPRFPSTSIQINHNYASRPHVDMHSLGMSYIVSLGFFTGGEIWVHDPQARGNNVLIHRQSEEDGDVSN